MKDLGFYAREVLKGDIDSFIPIIQTYEDKVSHTSHLYITDMERAEKLVLDTLCHVYSLLADYRDLDELSFDDWFVQTAFPYMMKQIEKETSLENKNGDFFFRTLQHKEQKVLILEHIFKLPISKISVLIGLEQMEVKRISYDTKRDLLNSRISEPVKQPCLNTSDLFSYAVVGSNKESSEDHLEFCPACRERLAQIARELNTLDIYLHPADEGRSYQERVLQKIKPFNRYGRKKKSWGYQLVSVVSIFIIFFGFLHFLPQLNEWKILASNYLQHGEFYNVWEQGTYVSTDKEISLEITNIEVTQLLTRIDYVIETERKLTESYEYTGKHFLVAKPGLVTIKIEEEMIPLENISIISTSEDLKEGSLYFELAEKTDLDLPDQFEFVLNTSRVGGVFGSWELEIPVEYKKGMKETETIELSETHTVLDTFDLKINRMETSATSNRLEVEVDFTEQEKARILHHYRENKSKNDFHYIEGSQIFYNFSLVNENGEPALQFHSYQHFDTDEITEEEMPTKIKEKRIFHNHFHDPDTMLATSPMEKREKLFFQLDDISYSEQIDISLEVDLKEVDRFPLNLEYNGTSFDYATITRLPEDITRPERYQLKIMGTQKENAFLKRFYWSIYPGEDRLSENFYVDSYWGDFGMMDVHEDPNTLYYLEFPVNQELPEKIALHSFNVTYHLPKEVKIKIPIN